ncbi:MAG: type II toxin-antitoxin system VapC family toxin [Verrucomicrobiota bacterium]
MPTAYIETTIPSYYTLRPARDVVQLTRQSQIKLWWDSGCSGFDLYTSQETIDEAGRGDADFAAKRLDLLNALPVLEVTQRVEDVTRRLLGAGLIPAAVASDALHIAVASVHRMDFLVTWNFKHIVNPHIRRRLQEEVASFGDVLPVLCPQRSC